MKHFNNNHVIRPSNITFLSVDRMAEAFVATEMVRVAECKLCRVVRGCCERDGSCTRKSIST